MNANKFFSLLSIIILLTACNNKKNIGEIDENEITELSTEIQAGEDLSGGNTDEYTHDSEFTENSMDVINLEFEQTQQEYELKYDKCLFPVDLEILGLTDITSFDEVVNKIPEKIIESINKINFNQRTLKSFSGLTEFVSLKYLELFNLEIENFIELSAVPAIEWLTVSNSIINTTNGLENFEKLQFLSLEGSDIIDLTEIYLPQNLEIIVLNKFKNYKKILDKLPDNIEQVYLNENNIKSVSEIENILTKKNIKRIFIKDNEIPIEALLNKRDELENIEIIWYET
jgi:hypothetical protein